MDFHVVEIWRRVHLSASPALPSGPRPDHAGEPAAATGGARRGGDGVRRG